MPSYSWDINAYESFVYTFAIVVDIPAPHYQLFSYLTESFSDSYMDNVYLDPTHLCQEGIEMSFINKKITNYQKVCSYFM